MTMKKKKEAMSWIDRRVLEPNQKDRILVWGKISFREGRNVYVCSYDYDDWLDPVDKVNVDFIYWMLCPSGPRF